MAPNGALLQPEAPTLDDRLSKLYGVRNKCRIRLTENLSDRQQLRSKIESQNRTHLTPGFVALLASRRVVRNPGHGLGLENIARRTAVHGVNRLAGKPSRPL